MTSEDEPMYRGADRRRHQEARRITDSLERRLAEVEKRIHLIELCEAEGRSMPEMLRDHEDRLRALEGIRWQLLASAMAGSTIGAGIMWMLAVLRGG